MAHWQLGEQDEARRWHGHALASRENDKRHDEEDLLRFRAEAEELLNIRDQKPATKPKSN